MRWLNLCRYRNTSKHVGVLQLHARFSARSSLCSLNSVSLNSWSLCIWTYVKTWTAVGMPDDIDPSSVSALKCLPVNRGWSFNNAKFCVEVLSSSVMLHFSCPLFVCSAVLFCPCSCSIFLYCVCFFSWFFVLFLVFTLLFGRVLGILEFCYLHFVVSILDFGFQLFVTLTDMIRGGMIC